MEEKNNVDETNEEMNITREKDERGKNTSPLIGCLKTDKSIANADVLQFDGYLVHRGD